MRSKIKISKISGVIFLTALIWVWADLALERPLSLSSQPILLVAPADPTIAIAFDNDGEYSDRATLNRVELSGPEATIRNLDREPHKKLDLSLIPETLGLTQEGSHTILMLDVLRQSISRNSRLAGLAVESCEPNTMTVVVQRLSRTTLPVVCYNQQTNEPLEGATVDPAEVEMFVSKNEREVRVGLTETEIIRARSNPIVKNPFVTVLGQRREANTSVRITAPVIEEQLEIGVISRPKLAYLLSPTLQNKYSVILDEANLTNALYAIKIRATVEARLAYEKSLYHVLLVIEDKDAEVEEIAPRRLRYNLPPEYEGNGQIMLDQDPVSVKFKLVPKTSNGPEAGSTD